MWLAAGVPASAQVEVTARADGLEVEARQAPLSELLDRIAMEVGARIHYVGAPPEQVVTVSARALTPAEAIMRVLDGQAVNYGLRLDSSGTGIDAIVISEPRSGLRPLPRRPEPQPPADPVPALPPQVQKLLEQAAGDAPPGSEETTPEGEPTLAPRAGQRRNPSPLLFPQPLTLPTPEPRPER